MAASNKVNPLSVVPEDMRVETYILKPVEHEKEMALRLHKDKVGFYIKDEGIWIFGSLCVLAIGAYCLWVLTSASSATAEKDWARSAISSILGGIIGFIFGKTAK